MVTRSVWTGWRAGEIETSAVCHRTIRQRADLAGDAQDREGVDQVRGDLELDHGVAEILRERRADRRVGFEDHDAFVLVGDAQLLLGADHPFRARRRGSRSA